MLFFKNQSQDSFVKSQRNVFLLSSFLKRYRYLISYVITTEIVIDVLIVGRQDVRKYVFKQSSIQ